MTGRVPGKHQRHQNDGIEDVILGLPSLSIVYGLSGKDLSIIGLIRGTPNTRFGHSVASVPDQNGDGTPEILIGAPNDGVNATGMAYLYPAVFGGVSPLKR